MCDGSNSVATIRSELAGGTDRGGREDIDAVLVELASRELVNLSPDPRKARASPVVRIGFTGFPAEYPSSDNIFATLLARRVTPWLVDPRTGQVDILFISDCSPQDPELLARQADALRVVVDTGGEFQFTGNSNAYIGAGQPAGETEVYLATDPLPWLGPERRAWPQEPLAGEMLRSILGEPQSTVPSGRGEIGTAPKLTVGMATYDDYDGVYFTIQSLRMFHAEVDEDIEFLVIDNNPRGAAGKAIQQLSSWIPNLRYVPCTEFNGTAVREYVFHHARGNAVLCMDSHVLLEPGALRRLLDYFDTHPDCLDLLQGPMVYDDLQSVSTHCDPVWRGGMFGTWGCDERGLDRDAEPFEIPLQGLGVFACRRDAWPGFNPAFRGFGGEEGYIHEKFQQAGRRTLCLPFLRWLHRFGRPAGHQYPNLWDDRMRNYFLACEELGLDREPVEDHFEFHVGPELVEHVRRSWLLERDNPFSFFDAIYCINLDRQPDRWASMSQRFLKLGIHRSVRRFSAVDCGDEPHLGCLFSHRTIIDFARRAGFQHVLVLEDDVIFHDETLYYLRRALAELKRNPWRSFYLGGAKWGMEYPKVSGCRFLERPESGPTTTHAVTYHCSSYDFLLDAIPDEPDRAREWLKKFHGIDQFLANLDDRFIISPVIATQASLMQYEDKLHRQRFTI